MFEKLLKLASNSYSPYSHFRVSAIVVMNDDSEFGGVNVENASYGASICAERNAIFAAITAGYHKGDFKELHILCADSNKISTCCFVCRQVISEFFDKECIITCYDKNNNVKKFTVADLCPYPFDEDDLK